MRNKIMAGILTIISCFAGCARKESNPEAVSAAVAAARTWLQIVDAGDYDKSWNEAAYFFKKAVPQSKWHQDMTAFRQPLGKIISREVKSSRYTTSVPGAPDGQYVVIQFTSSYENKKSAIETVTPTLDPDSKWRVSGYFIK